MVNRIALIDFCFACCCGAALLNTPNSQTYLSPLPMLLAPFLFFGLAIVSWRFAQHHPDDVGRFLGLSSTLVCLVAALLTASLILQGLMFVGLLLYPLCFSQFERS